MAGSDDEDDYMNMTFAETVAAAPETSLQRRQRLKREAEIRGRPKSKEELAADEAAARDLALSTSLLNPHQATKSKGLSMMKKMGFKGGALGAGGNGNAREEPIKPSLKEDRGGIGLDAERKRKVDEAMEREEMEGIKRVRAVDECEFRERVRREREAARWERQVYAAQKVAEKMDEERRGDEEDEDNDGEVDGKKKKTLSTPPLKSINVLWRGLVRRREEAERDRRMRYDLEQSLSSLPTYEDEHEDDDDKKALGKTKTEYMPVEHLEEEDAELDEFNALEPDEKLRRLVEYLRKEHRYCFWCKFEYPDDEMDACPGITEEDHD